MRKMNSRSMKGGIMQIMAGIMGLIIQTLIIMRSI
jgi:hypothetical protein